MDGENLHHAYLVLGPKDEARQWVLAQLGEFGVQVLGNPDLFIHEGNVFGVDEARALCARAQEGAFTGRKFFILSSDDITHQAQNALLKTFEEPVVGTHFFLISREEGLIIPTLRSRMQVVRPAVELSNSRALPSLRGLRRDSNSESSTPVSDADEFLRLTLKKRLAFAKKFADDERSLPEFLDELLLVLRSKLSQGDTLVSQVFKLRRYASDRSASSRQILEHLALVL